MWDWAKEKRLASMKVGFMPFLASRMAITSACICLIKSPRKAINIRMNNLQSEISAQLDYIVIYNYMLYTFLIVKIVQTFGACCLNLMSIACPKWCQPVRCNIA